MYIRVKAFPGSKKESVERIGESEYAIHIKEKAERNMANKRIIEIIAETYEVSSKRVRIINGHHSPTKLISIIDDSI
jgi:uncharacterized protein YggU (UPF0235/DUF167 family)